MGKTIKGQVLASTRLDLQGERTSLAILEALAKCSGFRVNEQHDFAKPTLGRIDNLRVEVDVRNPGEHVLLGDVTLDGDEVPLGVHGFSYSINVRLLESSAQTKFEIFVPRPHYQDLALLRELQAGDEDLAVGAWVKKALTPDQVALITTLIIFVFEPAWSKFFEGVVWPGIERAVKRLKALTPGVTSANILLTASGPGGEHVQVLLVPGEKIAESLSRDAVRGALGRVEAWLWTDYKAKKRRFKAVKASYDAVARVYRVFEVEYENGDVCNVVQ